MHINSIEYGSIDAFWNTKVWYCSNIFMNFSYPVFWLQNVSILPDQDVSISADQNVSIHFVDNLYNVRIRVVWHRILYMKTWYSSKSFWILTIFLVCFWGPKFLDNMANFYEMEFMKGIFMLVKVDEICNILKSLLATGYWSKDKGYVGKWNFLMESALQFPSVFYVSPFLRGRLHLLVTICYYFFPIAFILSV